MIRREVLTSLAALAAMPTLGGAAGATMVRGPGAPFSVARLRKLARAVAGRPFRRRPQVPQAWQGMSYDQYKGIRFDPAESLWRGGESSLQVELLAPGLYYPRPVEIHAVEDGEARPIPFDWSAFSKSDAVPDLPITPTLGYSGVRLAAELDGPDMFREYAVFQGGSYFRVVGAPNVFGLSARGLAIDTAAREDEEFPEFTRLWVERPAPGARTHRMHALLESPSVTGIYHFSLRPGAATEVDVHATLYPRVALAHVGIAPMTSMFYFDETNRGRFDDFRPAVHDSGGLSIFNGAGEMLWRPLANPRHVQVSSFLDDGPQGFGLAQRPRRFEDYADLDARYHERPSLWITPAEDWGAGAVVLMEIPTDREVYDNIVAYWRPREPLPAGQPHQLGYRMTWGSTLPPKRPVAKVLNTRIGRGFLESEFESPRGLVFAIDFEDHAVLPMDPGAVALHVGASRGEVTEVTLQRNPQTGGPRLSFRFDPRGESVAELRAQLRVAERDVSEVWLYRWTA